MFSQYFAQYLLNNNFLTAEQVRAILEEEHNHRVKLGVLAISKGLMTAEQVDFVHQMQVRFDKRFGEVAVNEGFLTDDQLEMLLTTQESANLNFGQAVVDRNFMTLQELESVIASYKSDNQMEINRAVNQIEITKIDFSEVTGVRELYGQYADLFLRALVRFVDTEGIILRQPTKTQEDTWLISQKMTGPIDLTAGIIVTEKVLVEMARRYSGEDINEVDELAFDSVAEFLNVTNGIFVVNLSNQRIEMEIEPQRGGKNIEPTGSMQAKIPIDTDFGEVSLLLAVGDIQ